MKKLLLFFVLMAALTITVAAQTPAINISLMNQDPDPVGPGEYVELRFSVQNTKPGSVAEDFEIQLDPRYPFSLDSSEAATRALGDLPALGDGSNVYVVKYKVRVAQDAVEGSVPIHIRYKHGTLSWITRQFDLDIQTLDANLAIISVDSVPEKIKPGEEATVNIKVKNMADSAVRDVALKLDLTYSGILSSVTTTTASDKISAFNMLPFAPVGSASEQKVYSLKAGEEHTFEYRLIAFSDAESQVYKVPVELTYYDELETQYSKDDIVGLVVGTKPDLSVIVDDSELYVGNRQGTVTIRFINKGFSDVKFLDVLMEDTDEFEVLSAKEVYVGNVDSDDYETAEFDIYLLNGATKEEKTIILPVNVEYRDTNNNLYQEPMELSLRVLSPAKLGMQSSSGGLYIFILILVVIAGIIIYRRVRKKKKK